MIEKIKRTFNESSKVKQTFVHENLELICEVVNKMIEKIRNGGKILFMGNGGSACDSQHIALELVGQFYKRRPPISALSLTSNSPLITEIANDFSFKDIFKRQIEALAKKEDIVVGISTSGKSINILSGLQMAKELGSTTIGLTGINGEDMKQFCDYLFVVPSKDTPRIQETHITLLHIIAQLMEEELI